MKKLFALLTLVSFTASTALATEPLLLDPISTTVLNDLPASSIQSEINNNAVNVTVPGQAGLQATYDANMVPQNDAAKGKPVKKKRTPRVRIETKQGRQTNTQWNPGGKGTKSFF
jgi:hypothetical protein